MGRRKLTGSKRLGTGWSCLNTCSPDRISSRKGSSYCTARHYVSELTQEPLALMAHHSSTPSSSQYRFGRGGPHWAVGRRSAATHGAAVVPREGWHHHHPALHQRWPYVPASARLLECGVQQQFAASLLPSVAMSSATGPVLGCAVPPAESRHSPPPHPPRRVPGTLGMCAQPRPQ